MTRQGTQAQRRAQATTIHSHKASVALQGMGDAAQSVSEWALLAAWQARFLAEVAEPALVAFGRAGRAFGKVAQEIRHEEGK